MSSKIPFYNVVNMLLTGIVFIGSFLWLFPELVTNILDNEAIKSLCHGPEALVLVFACALAYETGLIINRIGSIIIEKIFKKTKIIPFNSDYALFNEKRKVYPVMEILSREYALSRTGVTLFLLLAIIAGIAKKWIIVVVSAAIALLYFFSCRKHALKIVELMSVPLEIKK